MQTRWTGHRRGNPRKPVLLTEAARRSGGDRTMGPRRDSTSAGLSQNSGSLVGSEWGRQRG